MNDKNNVNTPKSSGFDALSEMLLLLKLDVNIYHNAKVCGNWRIDEHTLGVTCFHIVTMGDCKMYVPQHDVMLLNEGDLVIFPREITHHMLPIEKLVGEQQHLPYNQAIEHQGTGILCGEVRFQHKGYQFFLDELPVFFVIKNKPNNHWLQSVLELIVFENMKQQPASKSIINRLSELLFTYAIRQYLEDNSDQSGMLRVYADSRLMQAIECIHVFPEKSWTLERLAKEAGLSRTLFAEKFKAVSGWTPGQYLVWWRMQLAWSLLNEGKLVSQVAEHVGYKSESAFSRAFTKMFSVSAGKVRQGIVFNK